MSSKKKPSPKSGRDPHRQREQAKYQSPIASREHILSALRSDLGPMDFEALADHLDLRSDDDLEALRRRVGAMKRDGQLIQNRRRGLVPVDTEALIAGRISAHPDGFGFVIADDGDKDIYLNGKQMRQVFHGDRVVVCVTGNDHRGRREGRIVDVVERANKSLVGKLIIERGAIVVSPDNKRIHQDLLVPPHELMGAENGDIVVIEITEQPSRRRQAVGKVVEVLGQHLRPGMEIDVALHSHGIPFEWPDAVTDQAASFSTTVPSSAAKGRKDVRDLPLVTIDGSDARDFDDAVWCERTDAGWRLLVAIADVAHYVESDSPLDEEAIKRGTSVYFPGRVVPMLPEVLSNGLCSLNPLVDRLCMLCEITIMDNGAIRRASFYNGIMRSHARLTYSEVNEMLTDSTSSLRTQHEALMPMLEELHRLYAALAALRATRGAIEFDSTETRILFDDEKKISEIVPVVRNDAHKLIEECMILANIAAAAFLEHHEMPTLYRVHHGPKADRLEDLRSFLALRSLSLGGGDSPSALDYASLSQQIKDRPDRLVIQTVMLRSMQQAVYQPKNEGHFGLALTQYAHFTSPIRRYPDLMVHRAIKHVLSRVAKSKFRYSQDSMQSLGESCSATERRAEEASRDVTAWLKCEYMQAHVGSEFPGVVSAVTSFGLFVALKDIHVEGLIHVTNLSRDFYQFDQAAHALIGERTGQQYHLGDAINVQVAAVNLEERKIDFIEISQASGKTSKRSGRSSVKAAGNARAISRRERKKSRRKNKHEVKEKAQEVFDEILQLTSVTATAEASLHNASPQKRTKQPRAGTPKKKRGKKSTGKKVGAKKASAQKVAGKKVASKNATTKKVTSKNASVKKVASSATTRKKSSGSSTAKKKGTTKQSRNNQQSQRKVTKKVARKKVTKKAASTSARNSAGTSERKSASKSTSTSSRKTRNKKTTQAQVTRKKRQQKKIARKKVSKKSVTRKTSGGRKPEASSVVAKKKTQKKTRKKTTTKKTAVSKALGKARGKQQQRRKRS